MYSRCECVLIFAERALLPQDLVMLSRLDGYPGLVNRKPSTTEACFGFMVTFEFFYELVNKLMIFLFNHYENFPYVFYNAEIHVYRFRALS